MRGRLIFPFIAELHRLDTQAMAPDYDEDFKEPVLVDTDDDGVGEPFRREHPPVRVPCQVEPEALEALRMATSGNTPRADMASASDSPSRTRCPTASSSRATWRFPIERAATSRAVTSGMPPPRSVARVRDS